MQIYDYLFYKGYQLAISSRNFDEFPLIGALIFVGLCVMFNCFTILLVFEAIGWIAISYDKSYRLIVGLILIIILLGYYLFNSRYKRIIEKYEKLEREKRAGLHPLLVFLVYYGLSFAFLLIAGMYKNGDGIFANVGLPFGASLSVLG